MNLLLSLVVAILFGSGTFLILKRDLICLAVGLNLISNAAILFIIAAGLQRGVTPIYPLDPEAAVSDPLVQALALTSIVISFGIQIFVLALTYSVYITHDSLDEEEVKEAEERDVAQQQREAGAVS